jgi:hypothetical protein
MLFARNQGDEELAVAPSVEALPCFIEAEPSRLEALNEPDDAAGKVEELNGFFAATRSPRETHNRRRREPPASSGVLISHESKAQPIDSNASQSYIQSPGATEAPNHNSIGRANARDQPCAGGPIKRACQWPCCLRRDGFYSSDVDSIGGL